MPSLPLPPAPAVCFFEPGSRRRLDSTPRPVFHVCNFGRLAL